MTLRPGNARPASPAVMALALTLFIIAACAKPSTTRQYPESDAPPPEASAEISQPQDRMPGEPAGEKNLPLSRQSSAAVTELDNNRADPGIDSAPAPTAKKVMPPINDDPHQLMGLAPGAVNSLLGPPSLLRTEAPAEVWQYAAEDCVLDIYLYAEEQMPDRSRVTYYEIRPSETAKRDARACFGKIIQSWNNAGGGTP